MFYFINNNQTDQKIVMHTLYFRTKITKSSVCFSKHRGIIIVIFAGYLEFITIE